jgi:hypothetical protein
MLLASALALSAVTSCNKAEPSAAAQRPPEAATIANVGSAAPAANPVPAPAAGGKHLGSCTIMGIACSDYTGSALPDVLRQSCEGVGKWSEGACPTAGVQGTCTKPEPGGIVNATHSYAPGTPETAKKACDNTPGGVFTAK